MTTLSSKVSKPSRGSDRLRSEPREGRWGRLRERISPYVAISPFLILFALFSAYPLIYGGWLALQSWDGISPATFVGFDNFKQMFSDPTFWQATLTTVEIFLGSTIPLMVFALIAAFAVGALPRRSRAVLETFLISPVVISSVAAALIFQAMFSQSYGLVNVVLKAVGIGAIPWLSTDAGIKTTIILMVVWKNLGYFTVIFIAGLATVPTEITEAARLDGTNALQLAGRIILPSLRPVIIFSVLTASVNTFQTFAEPQVLVGTGGGTGHAGLTLMLYQFASSFQPGSLTGSPQLGYAAAVGWAVFLMLVVISGVSWIVVRKFGQKD